MLMTPPLDGAADLLARNLAEAMESADVAAVIVPLGDAGERELINRVKTVAKPVQAGGAALLLAGHAALVARAGADGAHIADVELFADALGVLKPDRIAGAGRLPTRHEAMSVAEAGADYVMFGEPDAEGRRPAREAMLERIAWWADVFEAPCVGYAGSADEIAPLVAAGADFIALDPAIWITAPRAALAAATADLAIAEPTP
jgi:thiamine-phosphate pyrophosphorylase